MTTTNKQCEAKKRHCSRLLVLMCGFVLAIQLRSTHVRWDSHVSKLFPFSWADVSNVTPEILSLENGILFYVHLYNALRNDRALITEEKSNEIQSSFKEKNNTEKSSEIDEILGKMDRVFFAKYRTDDETDEELREWVLEQFSESHQHWDEFRVLLMTLILRKLNPNSWSSGALKWKPDFQGGKPTEDFQNFLETKSGQRLIDAKEAAQFLQPLMGGKVFNDFAKELLDDSLFPVTMDVAFGPFETQPALLQNPTFDNLNEFVGWQQTTHDNPLELRKFDEIGFPYEWFEQFGKNDLLSRAIQYRVGDVIKAKFDETLQEKIKEVAKSNNKREGGNAPDTNKSDLEYLKKRIVKLEEKTKQIGGEGPDFKDENLKQLVGELNNRIAKLEHDAKKTDGEGPDFKDEDLKQLAENLRAFYQFGTDFWIGICGCILGFVGIALFVTIY